MTTKVKGVFTCEDIHNVRLELAEIWEKMTPEEALADFQMRAERTRSAIRRLRQEAQRQENPAYATEQV